MGLAASIRVATRGVSLSIRAVRSESTMEVAVPGRTPRKPLLCRLDVHEWVPSVNPNGGDNRVCAACGKVAESLAPLTIRWMRSQLCEGTLDPVIDAVHSAPYEGGTGTPADGTFSWAPDPTGTHDLRLIVDGRWTSVVVTDGLLSSDATLSGPAWFDWTGPAAAPTRSTANEWLPAGTYVFRSKWEKPMGILSEQPVWYSPVWTEGRPRFLIEDNGMRFTAVDSGTSYPATRRTPRRIRTQFRESGDGGLSIRATSNGAVIDSATGTLIASTYSVANQRPDTRTGDHTVVITVPNAIPMRLWPLTLSYATGKHPYIELEG